MSKQFISTSIAYINAEPHIGFLLELVAADVLARYHKQLGEDVFFLTGTDEHGTKVEQAAKAANLEPQQFADQISEKFKDLGKDFNLSFDYFVRTTDQKHIDFVQAAWKKLVAKGVIKKDKNVGFYCTGCEAFKTEREIVDGKCNIHETPLEKIEEENYFLVLTDDVKNNIKTWVESPAVQPAGRKHEVLNMLKEIDKVSVSRPVERLRWGIPVPDDDQQVLYVWVDALLNYLSGIEASGRSTDEWWEGKDSETTQIIGKDILKFHAVIWPAVLLALGHELPKNLLIHGFVNVEGKKMSKSLGNVITPAQLKDRYGVDGTRYLLLRQLSFYDDSNFSWAEFDAIYNGELANGIGNLVGRLIGIEKKLDQKIVPVWDQRHEEEFNFEKVLNNVNDNINSADQLISREKLWENPQTKIKLVEEVSGYLFTAVNYLEPYMPESADEIRRQLTELDPKPLFPRLDTK